MIRIITIQVGFLSTNCYIVYDDSVPEKPGVVIDPGSEDSRIVRAVRDEGITVKCVFITHGHYDHVGAVAGVVTEFECPVVMSRDDQELYSGQSDFIETLGGDVHESFEYFKDGGVYPVTGELKFKVISTPGHSEGGVCLALDPIKSLFTGDTLFEGTVGRTDLPGSDPEAMRMSLERIVTGYPDYKVYPGHGGPSTMEKERKTNAFIRRIFRSD